MLLASLGMVLLASLEIGLVDWRPGILGSVSWLCEDVYVLVVLLFYPVIRTGASSSLYVYIYVQPAAPYEASSSLRPPTATYTRPHRKLAAVCGH